MIHACYVMAAGRDTEPRVYQYTFITYELTYYLGFFNVGLPLLC